VARMIPPVIASSCPSPGEREIFLRLKNEAAASDWIVLHSLDIAHHQRQVSGEADFVIIVPYLGVLCLEVKACHSLVRRDGLWFYGQETHGDARGPFRQSSEAMHSLRQQVLRIEPTLSRIPFWSAVAFPYVDLKTVSDEWHPWQVIDAQQFRRQPLAANVSAILRNARTHLSSQPTCSWFREADRLPDIQQAAAIARILRPNFEFTEKAEDRRARQKADILRYTEEQYAAIDAMSENDRVLFTGPAGTGKTVLALEAARRAASAGQTVLLLCYNRLLGRWLLQQPVANSPAITVATLHQYMANIARIALPDGTDESFWKSDLPEAAITRLLAGHSDASRFDVVVADEVQDLLAAPYLDVLDLVLQGGLAAGHWMMFGDFERQMLYGQDRDQTDELLRARFGAFARCSLRVNCRNSPRVATLSHLLGKLTPNYSRILRPDDRIEPVITYYSTPSQQRRGLVATLDRLYRESFAGDDIVLLSPKAGQRCAAAGVAENPWCNRIAYFEQAAPGQIRYTTIQSFKGLDSPAIVVTDVEHLAGELFSSLFYVATTRALERLSIIVHETAKPDIIAALVGTGQV
jgi:Nuclease-related domain/UvrD-like helicase C-terminal domain/PhoH-like protein